MLVRPCSWTSTNRAFLQDHHLHVLQVEDVISGNQYWPSSDPQNPQEILPATSINLIYLADGEEYTLITFDECSNWISNTKCWAPSGVSKAIMFVESVLLSSSSMTGNLLATFEVISWDSVLRFSQFNRLWMIYACQWLTPMLFSCMAAAHPLHFWCHRQVYEMCERVSCWDRDQVLWVEGN